MLLVPSEGKEQAWETYQQERPRLLRERIPTAELLPALHEIATRHYGALSFSPDALNDLELQLLSLDRPDGRAFFAQVETRALARGEDDLERAIREGASENTSISLNPKVSGALRRLGTRRIEGYPEEEVYAAHTQVFGNGLFVTGMYVGLSDGLGEVYGQLCAKHDELRARATNRRERLLGEAFLQLLGTRVLHPFWDGNGRSFGYHTALTLEREGASPGTYKELARLVRQLAPTNDAFLTNTLNEAGLRILHPSEFSRLQVDPEYRESYMGKLRTTLEQNIARGLDRDHISFCFYDEVASLLEEHVAHATGTPYARTEFPKERLVQRMAREQPERLRHAYPISIFRGIEVLDGQATPLLTIGADDLQPSDVEREHFSRGEQLATVRAEIYDAHWYGPQRYLEHQILEGHPVLEFYTGMINGDITPRRPTQRILRLFPGQRAVLDRLAEVQTHERGAEPLSDELKDLERDLLRPAYAGRMIGTPLEIADRPGIERADALLEQARTYLATGRRLVEHYGEPD
jgi:fido (protein-threonine AMPylation protein)